jgi:NADH-quinone oxidoreductase subunit K
VIPLSHVLMLSGILFSLSLAGIFINRKNVLLLLMCIELMLLSVNFNFIAFSQHLGDLGGQVFVFFILTVAAAESASVLRSWSCCSASAAASTSRISTP